MREDRAAFLGEARHVERGYGFVLEGRRGAEQGADGHDASAAHTGHEMP